MPPRLRPRAGPSGSGLTRSARTLAGFMVAAGLLHFVIPRSYARIVPRVLGHARGFVAVTGAAELVAGALLAVPRTRRAGAWLTFGLLVGVWPANVQMALDGGIAGAAFPLSSATVAWARVPLQVPLLVWAWRQTRPDRACSADPVAGAGQGRR